MPLPEMLKGHLSVPVVQAPMFLVSNPKMVTEACKSGIVGSFPSLNQRSSEGFERWLKEITEELQAYNTANSDRPAAPFGVNLIVHASNPRMEEDLKLCVKYEVPLVITAMGAVREVVDTVHSYGGIVFHDATNLRHAKKAASVGVDGLILVCAGAGGHAGTLSPFALLPEVRGFFDKTILLAGCISDGRSVAAARMLGADLAYVGSRFINVSESGANDYLKEVIIGSAAADIVYTAAISGVPCNFLRQSIIDAGLDPDNLASKDEIDFGKELQYEEEERKAWKDIFSAGQGVGAIMDTPMTAELCARLRDEYEVAMEGVGDEALR